MWRVWVSIFLLSGIFVANVSAQNYQVTATGYPGVGGWSIKSFNCSAGSATGSSKVFSSIPTGSFSITFSPPFGSGYSDCTLSGTMSGCSGSGSGTATPCGGNGTSWGISLYTEAIVAIEPGTSTPNSYCVNENITLVATPGFPGYNWEYRVESGGWQSLSTVSGSTVTFGIQDVFGSLDAANLNKDIYFRCNLACKTTSAVGPYKFSVIPLLANNHSKGEISCYGSGNGSLTVTSYDRSFVSGESLKNLHLYTQPILNVAYYVKSSLPNDNTISGISPGSYYVLVEGSVIPCSQQPDFYGPIIFNNPAPVTITDSVKVKPLCNGDSNGSITITASGESGRSFEYSRDNGSSFQSSNVFTGLAATSYLMQVRDNLGCLSAKKRIIIDPPPPILITSAYVSSSYNGKDIRCAGGSDGHITVEASGGTGTLDFSNGGSFILGNTPTGHVFNTVGEGSYTITVRDDNNCSKNYPTAVALDAPDAITATITPTKALCNGGNGTITIGPPSGGVPGYTYSFNDGTNYSATATFNGVANTYKVKIKDANNCETTAINTTIDPTTPIGITGTPTLVTCFGGNDGTVEITTTNAAGTPSFTLIGGTGTFIAPNKFIGLSASTYNITATDGNGCTGTGNVTISSNPIITGPIAISTPISCNGGNNGVLNLTPGGGGLGPYTFTWSNGSTTEDISGLTANTYSVTVKDNLGCTQNFSRVLGQPLPVTASYTTSNFNGSGVSCFGSTNGSINLTPAGGNGGYTYLWSNSSTAEDLSSLSAGTYNVAITDSKSCTGNQSITLSQPVQLVTTINGQNIACFGANTGSITLTTTGGTTNYEYSINGGTNWQSTPTFINRIAGSYTVLTRDANSCADTDNITLTSPTDLILGVTNGSTTCNQSNGTAQVTATGGVSNYNFTWFNSSNTQIGTNNTINNLAAGIYRVVVTDQNSCTKQQNVTISSSDGPAITTTSITAASCSNRADGTATISITQGESPYTILWPNNQTTATATNLAGGDYIVQVRDNTNCLALQTVTVPAPPELILQTITQQDPNCNGTSDGQITVNAQGGNGTYSYSWNTGSTNNALTNLTAGTYTVTVKDIKNCQTIQQYTLTNPPIFTIDLGADQSICEGQIINKSSSVDNATYAWTGPNNFTNTQQQVSVSDPGTYTLTVTNQNGCKATDSFTLTINTDLLKADFLMVSEAFAGDTVIVIDISWPIPTSVNWQFETGATIIDQSPDYALIRYDEPGTYNTTMQAQLAQCVSTYSQSLIILENPNPNRGGREGRGVIKDLSIYPNPVSEKLNAVIDLYKKSQVVIELYHLNTNKRVLAKQLDDQAYYETELELNNLNAGIYVIVVKAGNEVKSVKVIKV